MEKTNLHYSNKNIPLSSQRHYKSKLIEKIELFIKRMRWRAIFADNPDDANDNESMNENYGLKTQNTQRQVPKLKNFEEELIGLVEKVKFRKGTNIFQTKVRDDINNIKSSYKVFVPADKTSNMYKVSKIDYQKLLTDSITKVYQLSYKLW